MKKMVLATNSAKHLGLDTGKVEIGRFTDGEVSIVLREDVAGKKVWVIGSTNPPAENLIELLLLLDTVVHHGAEKITLVIPYFGYGKSDMEKVRGQSISAQAVTRLIELTGGPKLAVIAVNLHSPAVEKSFTVSLRNVSLMGVIANRFCKPAANLAVVSPDAGGVKRAEEFAEFLGKNATVTINKKRLGGQKVKTLEISGEVRDRDVVIVDDMVQSGSTILSAVKALKEKGAREIFVAVTHMVYSARGWKKLARCHFIKKVVTTDTIKPPPDLPPKFEVVSATPLLKQLIYG